MTDVILEGYLSKKSPHTILGRHRWQRRYFVLNRNTLSYYKQHSDYIQQCVPAGIFRHEMIHSLELYTLKHKHAKIYNTHSNSIHTRFNITIVGTRIFELECDTEIQRNKWIESIQQCIQNKPIMKIVDSKSIQSEYWRPAHAQHNNTTHTTAAITGTVLPAVVTQLLHRSSSAQNDESITAANDAAVHMWQESEQLEHERLDKAAQLDLLLNSNKHTTPLLC